MKKEVTSAIEEEKEIDEEIERECGERERESVLNSHCQCNEICRVANANFVQCNKNQPHRMNVIAHLKALNAKMLNRSENGQHPVCVCVRRMQCGPLPIAGYPGA